MGPLNGFVNIVCKGMFCLMGLSYYFAPYFLFLLFTAALSNACHFSAEKCTVFRPDKSSAVTRGKWYFEFETLTAGSMRVGWARPGCSADRELGSDDQAYVFDGYEVRYSEFTVHRVVVETAVSVNHNETLFHIKMCGVFWHDKTSVIVKQFFFFFS